MYMRGMNNVYDDADAESGAVFNNGGGAFDWLPSVVSTPSAGGDINWTGALNTAISAWTAKNNADTQLEIAKMQAQQRALPYSTIPGYYGSSPVYSRSGLSPFPGAAGSIGGLDFTTLAIIGALIAGGYFLLKD